MLGLEAGAGDLVQPQRQELAVVEDLAAPVTPGDVELLVEARRRQGTRGEQDRQHRNRHASRAFRATKSTLTQLTS